MGKWFFFVFLIGVFEIAFCSTPDFPKCPPYWDVSRTWAEKNYDQALETLMPNSVSRKVAKDEWILNIRINPSFFDESQFTFIRFDNGKVQGIATSPSKGKISNQLSELKQSHPEVGFNELIKMVGLNRWQKTFNTNKKLENKIRFLQEYKLRSTSKDLFCLDSTSYEILLQTVAKKVDFSFGCTEQDAELLPLVKEFRDQLYGYKQIDYDLLKALEKKNVKTAIQLIQDGANPEFQTEEGDQSWLSALMLRNPELIKVMLQKQPKLIHQGKPVLEAASYGSWEIITVLVEASADINESVRGETPIIGASGFLEESINVIDRTANDYEQVVNQLIKAGADLNKRGNDGSTALMVAIDNRHETIAESLIDAGADLNTVDNCGDTALILAAKEGQQKIVEKLIRAGANPKIINGDGKTAMDYAQEKGFDDLVRLLR